MSRDGAAAPIAATPVLAAVGPDVAPALAEIHALSFPKPWSATELSRSMRDAGAFTLAACADGAPLGFVITRALAGEAEVITLAVRPDQRRRKLGRALLEAAAATAASRYAEVLWLEVAEDNAAAIALYLAAGFEVTGRRPAYYARPGGERADALVMRRDLNTGPR